MYAVLSNLQAYRVPIILNIHFYDKQRLKILHEKILYCAENKKNGGWYQAKFQKKLRGEAYVVVGDSFEGAYEDFSRLKTII